MCVDTATDLCPTWPRESRQRAGWLPVRMRELVHELEVAPTVYGVQRFERELAIELDVDAVLCVWMDWPRRVAWSVAGPLSARLQELVPEVAGRGKRCVLTNAIIEPIGPAPARGALVVKGVLLPHVVRTTARIASRLGPVLDRLDRLVR